MFDVEKILQTTSIRQLVEKAGGSIDSHGRGCCVLHGGTNDNAFSIFQKDGKEYWKCHSGDCGGGDLITFTQIWQNMDFKQACAFLGGDVASDPVAMEKSARERLERAKLEHEEARQRMEARRAELQVAQLHLHYHETMKDWARVEWITRGLDESWQGFWTLGACDDKTIMFKGEEYHTPTITIPLVDTKYNLLNIKHRLINPPKKNDKYRPEREGLGTFPPFIAFPDVGYNAEVIWIMEGEIKAMVTATISPSASWQFIGVPGQDSFEKLPMELFKGKSVIVVPDPGAEVKAWNFANKIGAKYLHIPDKIDDLILANDYEANWLNVMSKQARKAKR